VRAWHLLPLLALLASFSIGCDGGDTSPSGPTGPPIVRGAERSIKLHSAPGYLGGAPWSCRDANTSTWSPSPAIPRARWPLASARSSAASRAAAGRRARLRSGAAAQADRL